MNRLERWWREFHEEHLFAFESGHLTKILITIAILTNVVLWGPVIISITYIPQPFTAVGVYCGWALGITGLTAYGVHVGRYYT